MKEKEHKQKQISNQVNNHAIKKSNINKIKNMALALWPKSTKDHCLSKTRAGKPFTCQICKKRFTSKKNKRAHASKHIARLPHHCNVRNKTLQPRPHLLKHATTQVISAKINKFLESFSPSSCEIRNSYKSTNNDIALHSPTANNENEDTSIQLSVNNLPITDDLKAAAAKTASACGVIQQINSLNLIIKNQKSTQALKHQKLQVP